MAQSTNLTISVGVDAGKATADIAILKAQIQALTKELNAAAKEALKTGDTTKVKEYGRQVDVLKAQLRALTQQQSALTAATHQTNKAEEESILTMRELTKYAREFGVVSGVSLESVKGLRLGLIGLATATTVRAFNEVIAKITELNEAAKGIGISPQGLQTFEKAVVSAGGTAEGARAAITSLGKAWIESGQEALEAGKTLGNVGQVVRGNVRDTTSNITNLAGSITTVLHGTAIDAVKFADTLKNVLHIDRSTFGPGVAEFQRFVVEVSKRIVDLNKTQPDQANIATLKIFGQTWAQLGESLKGVVESGSLEALGKALGVHFITPADIKAAEDYKKALDDLKESWEALQRTLAISLAPGATGFLKQFTEDLEKGIENFKTNWLPFFRDLRTQIDSVIDKYRELKAAALGAIPAAPTATAAPTGPRQIAPGATRGSEVIAPVPPAAPTATTAPTAPTAPTEGVGVGTVTINAGTVDVNASGGVEAPQPAADIQTSLQETKTELNKGIGDILGGAVDDVAVYMERIRKAITDALAAAAASAASIGAGGGATPSGGAGAAAPSNGGESNGGFASGGFVRGPGTGRSDSILARLSNGEYVVNAASVRAVGTGLLDSLNSFARGGLVAMPPIRFAEGGLVTAASSSGRPVHLHLGSQSFALSGSEHVVDALVGAAHAQQIRSTGVKPSWFAGRPSGR